MPKTNYLQAEFYTLRFGLRDSSGKPTYEEVVNMRPLVACEYIQDIVNRMCQGDVVEIIPQEKQL